ncbi:MAG: OadG family protein [Clostridiales bacterium]|nr:OadG family protein [Clostridiales bacterium]
MSLMEQFANPTYFEGLSMGERLTGATVTMCMGLGITFAVLVILWVCIAVMAKITHRSTKASDSAAAPASAPAPAAAPAETPAPAAETADMADGELVAVIAAAVAAMENTVVSNLVVKKITRVSGPTNAWASAGLSECIDSRRM